MKKETIFDPEIKEIDEKKRIIWHTITKEVPDRLGDIVRIDGLNLKEFKKKPAVLYGHSYQGINPVPVIAENVGFKKEGKKLYAGTKFHAEDADISQPLKDLTNDLWFLNSKKLMGWSIGFKALETKDIYKDGKWVGWDFLKSNLLEYSNVVIPAHQDAINDAIQSGLISKSFLERTIDTRSLGETLKDALDEVSATITATTYPISEPILHDGEIRIFIDGHDLQSDEKCDKKESEDVDSGKSIQLQGINPEYIQEVFDKIEKLNNQRKEINAQLKKLQEEV